MDDLIHLIQGESFHGIGDWVLAAVEPVGPKTPMGAAVFMCVTDPKRERWRVPIDQLRITTVTTFATRLDLVRPSSGAAPRG